MDNMPHKGGKGKAKEHKKAGRKDSNSEIPRPDKQPVDDGGASGGEAPDGQPKFVSCCVPALCEIGEEIDANEPVDAVKVVCNNDQCEVSGWMHHNCFIVWEESVLSYLRSCGRARSWSEKQRLQNLWTKKGYDLAYKACDCKCGRGHLRKDLDYFPKPVASAAKKKHHKKSSELPTLTVSSKGHHVQPVANGKKEPAVVKEQHQNGTPAPTTNGTQHRERVGSFGSGTFRERGGSIGSVSFRERVNSASSCVSNGSGTFKDVASPRDRANSVGSFSQVVRSNMSIPGIRNRHSSCQSMTSTGSSPPNSSHSMESPASSSPGTPCTPVFGKPAQRKQKFDFTTSEPAPAPVINGGIFKKRESLNSFTCLPNHKRNPYHIKMEEDGSIGNDEIRNFLLSNLSGYKASSVHCLLCRNNMPVFDNYPIIDGTFFLSPVSYDDVVSYRVGIEGKKMFLHAVCIFCLEGAVRLLCQFCNQTWDGSTLVLGTMYSYDIFAASACCEKRFTCKTCSAPVTSFLQNQNVHFFSEFSQKIECQRCHCEDHHFVKPLQELFYAQSICN